MKTKPMVSASAAVVIGGALAGPAFATGMQDMSGPSLEPTYETYGVKSEWPDFIVDPRWPKPLPNNWILGQVGGIAVDRHDNIWILQRSRSLDSSEAGALGAYVDPVTGEVATNEEGVPINALGQERPLGPVADCCIPAPAVLKFDPKGNLLDSWGGPSDEGYLGSDKCREEEGCVWPAGEHGLYVDHNDFVYIGGNGSGDGEFPWDADHGIDGHVMKFTSDGTHVLTVGMAGPDPATVPDSNDTDGGLKKTPQLYLPADSEVDPHTNELYIADGYGNRRVVVVDAETGQYKRHWGAYGMVPVDDTDPGAVGPGEVDDREAGITPQQFRTPVHCVRITKDRMVYVCDRVNNRIQVFKTDGTFVEEKFIRIDTLGAGSVWDLDTSTDHRQSCLYNVDGTNMKADTLHRRSLTLLTSFGRHGRYAGQFHWVHNVAIDSEGNMYTAEVDTGKRAQKFDHSGVNYCRLLDGDHKDGADAKNQR